MIELHRGSNTPRAPRGVAAAPAHSSRVGYNSPVMNDQAFPREFISTIQGDKHKTVGVVPKEEAILPSGVQVRIA